MKTLLMLLLLFWLWLRTEKGSTVLFWVRGAGRMSLRHYFKGTKFQLPSSVNDGKWHYVGFSKNPGTGFNTLYLDGEIEKIEIR